MKKGLLLLLAIALCAMSTLQASVVMGTVNVGQYNGTLDFNNDGNADFYIQSTSAYETDLVNCVIRFTWSEGGNNIWTVGNIDLGQEGWDWVNPLTAGASIGANANWQAQGDAYLADVGYGTSYIPVNQDVYIGFRLKINGNTHYGWAKVRMTGSDATGYTAQWIECAYESTPNTPIAAGATGVGINENEKELISVYPNPTADFVTVENASNQEVAVFDMNGRQINAAISTENGRSTIDLTAQPAGVYFIRMAGTSAKITKW